MKHLILAFMTLLIAGAISGCASSPSAAPSCDIESKTETAQDYIKRMQRETRKNVRKLTILSQRSVVPNTIPTQTQSRIVTILRDIDLNLKQGRGLLRLKLLSEACADPQLIEASLSELLMTDTMNPDLLAFIKSTEIYRLWLSSSSYDLRAKAVELDIPLPRMEDF